MQFYADNYRDVLSTLSANCNRGDPYAVRRACVELSRLVIHRHAVRHTIVEDGILMPELLEMVRGHVETQPEVVMDASRFLRRLISLKEPTELDIQSKITEAGWLPLLVRAATIHTGDRKLFVEICALASLLCFDMPAAPHMDNQNEMRSSGLLLAVCARMKADVSEEEALEGCSVVGSILYEHVDNVVEAVESLELLPIFSRVLGAFPRSPRIVQTICQALFHVVTLQPRSSIDTILQLNLLQDVVQSLVASAWFRSLHSSGERSLLLWHVVKLFEVVSRHSDAAKDAFCESDGVLTVIRAVARCAEPKDQDRPQQCSGGQDAVSFVACMLFCRLASTSDDAPVVHMQRVASLMQAGAHQFALELIQGASRDRGPGSTRERSGLLCTVEQAVRLLELVARVEGNRVPLTRLGASRHVKVVYNSVDMTAQPGLLVLCERAVAAIEGT